MGSPRKDDARTRLSGFALTVFTDLREHVFRELARGSCVLANAFDMLAQLLVFGPSDCI